jgi:transcriptional regulator with XRE-family HTH domain
MLDQPVQRRLVGAALRRYRERLGFRLADAAGVLECNASKISRIETGERGIRPLELRMLLGAYEVGEEEQQTLLAAASSRLALGWWRDYLDVLPAPAPDYLFLERVACGILRYDAQRIPDIVQAPGYTQALADLTADQQGPDLPGRLAEMQRARQQAILQAGDHPAVSVVIGEGALRHEVGDAAVMRGQVQHLLEVNASCPWVAIQVLPLSSFAQATVTSGSLEILRFAGSPALGVVRLAVTAGIEICHVDEESIAAAVNAFILVKKAALNPQASMEMLRSLSAG